jgi:hypothetical protein
MCQSVTFQSWLMCSSCMMSAQTQLASWTILFMMLSSNTNLIVIQVSRDVMLRHWLSASQYFEGPWCHHCQESSMWGTVQPMTQCHIREDQNPQQHFCENLRSHRPGQFVAGILARILHTYFVLAVWLHRVFVSHVSSYDSSRIPEWKLGTIVHHDSWISFLYGDICYVEVFAVLWTEKIVSNSIMFNWLQTDYYEECNLPMSVRVLLSFQCTKCNWWR